MDAVLALWELRGNYSQRVRVSDPESSYGSLCVPLWLRWLTFRRGGPGLSLVFHKCKSDTFSRCSPISIRGSRGTFNHTIEVSDGLRFTVLTSPVQFPIFLSSIRSSLVLPPLFTSSVPPTTPSLPLCHFFTSLSMHSEEPL